MRVSPGESALHNHIVQYYSSFVEVRDTAPTVILSARSVCSSPFQISSQGQRLRASGRLQEADEVDDMAAAIEARAEDQWRKTVEVGTSTR